MATVESFSLLASSSREEIKRGRSSGVVFYHTKAVKFVVLFSRIHPFRHLIYAEKSLINLILLYTRDTQTHRMTERRLHDMAPSSSAGPGDDMHWERNFIHQIKTLKSGSKDQLDSLTDLAINDASKRYKSVVNIVSKYSQTMKPKYRPSMMYVISSLVMHENEKIASLYRQRFAIEISVLVEKICECRTEQLERVRRNIERWREKECFESLVLDECEYHVQKFEEAGKEAEEEERRKEEDGLLGMERIETPPPPEEEEEKKVEEEGEKPTTISTVNKWPKLMPTWGKNVKRQQKQQQQQQQQKKQNKKRNREKFTNGSLRQQQQNMQPMNQQQKQQSQHGQGKPTKKQKRRMQKKKQGDKNESNKEQRQQEKGGGGGGEKGDQKKSVIDRLT